MSTANPTVDADFVDAWMRASARALHEACPYLTELDSQRGDADHGVNMERGFGAIVAALDDAAGTGAAPASGADVLALAAATLRRIMGGTTGPLWTMALRRAGKALEGGEPNSPADLAAALAAAGEGVAELGEASEGENTLLDSLLPAARTLAASLDAGTEPLAALTEAKLAAEAGAEATAGRIATKGRGSYLGERGASAADPGATSAAVVVAALETAAREQGW